MAELLFEVLHLARRSPRIRGSRRASVVPTSDDDTEDAECVGRDSDHTTDNRTDALFPGEPLN